MWKIGYVPSKPILTRVGLINKETLGILFWRIIGVENG